MPTTGLFSRIRVSQTVVNNLHGKFLSVRESMWCCLCICNCWTSFPKYSSSHASPVSLITSCLWLFRRWYDGCFIIRSDVLYCGHCASTAKSFFSILAPTSAYASRHTWFLYCRYLAATWHYTFNACNPAYGGVSRYLLVTFYGIKPNSTPQRTGWTRHPKSQRALNAYCHIYIYIYIYI